MAKKNLDKAKENVDSLTLEEIESLITYAMERGTQLADEELELVKSREQQLTASKSKLSIVKE